ncbi:MAG: hypothetical protein GKS05_07565 [Nitrospirales bacterium]|nr:hypothetical protein [Nitrospirales bacterium]
MSFKFLCIVMGILHILAASSFAQSTSPEDHQSAEGHAHDTKSASKPLSSDSMPATNEAKPVPSVEIQKAQAALAELQTRPKEYRVLILGIQIFLGRFGYGTGPYTGELDEQTRSALRAYQQYVGIPVTGELTYLTLEHLTNDNKTLDQILPFLPRLAFHDKEWAQAIRIEGTWALTGESQPSIPQTTIIACERQWNRCVESTAAISATHAPRLSIKTHVYEIGSWDDNDIVTKPNSSEPCTSAIVRINRKEQTVFRLLSIQEGPGACADMDNRDLHYRLVSGEETYWQLKQRKAESTKRILRINE